MANEMLPCYKKGVFSNSYLWLQSLTITLTRKTELKEKFAAFCR